MTREEQKLLLQLARKAIEDYGRSVNLLNFGFETIPQSLKVKQGSFVTLAINGQLRGCIGYLEGQDELWQDIINNAVSAGFKDPRFPPLSQDEIPLIHIEISILSQPKVLNYATDDELLTYLAKNQPGVIIRQGVRRATYLPQVWQDLSDPSKFLSNLCLKAGLPSDTWKEKNIEVYAYHAQIIEEEQK